MSGPGVSLSRRITARRAAAVLHRLFGHLEPGFAFRLWDGRRVALGRGEPVCTVVIHRPETFVRLVRDPSPLNFAEAYVESAIDLEGDLFAAMSIANCVEQIHVSLVDRMRILSTLWRG